MSTRTTAAPATITDDRVADALAPAPFGDSVRYLGTLPSRPRARWVVAFAVIFTITLIAMMFSANLFGYAAGIVSGESVPVLDSGTRGFALLLAAIAVTQLVEAAGRAFGMWLIVSKTRQMSVDLRRGALSAVLRAPISDVLTLGTGNVITRLTKDIDQTVRIIGGIGVRLVVTILMFPFTMVSLALIDWRYLIIFAILATLTVPILRSTLIAMREYSNIVSSAEARRNNLLLDTIRGIPTLRAMRLDKWALGRMQKGSWNAVQANADRAPVITRLIGQATFGYGLLLIATFVVSAMLYDAGELSLGAAAAAAVLVSRMEVHIFNVLMFAGEIQKAATGLGRAVALATLADGTADLPEPDDLDSAPEIRIDGLDFAYPDGANVLEGVSLTLAAGTTTALVGASGAGKSTLAAVIAGLQRPSGGRIRIGDVDTAEVADVWTARNVTLISQEVHLFAGTLREDLHMAAPDAGDDVLKAALAETGLVEGGLQWGRWLPLGLDTRVGAGADELGPEVVQQISLARIILQDPPALIMDEATAEAGSDHARALEQAAIRAASGRTSLVVAHRLDQAIAADRVVLMAEGAILEDGTHDELVAKGGRYAQLYARWAAN